jgi:hypothetical protein
MNIFPVWANIGTWTWIFFHHLCRISHVPKFAHTGMLYCSTRIVSILAKAGQQSIHYCLTDITVNSNDITARRAGFRRANTFLTTSQRSWDVVIRLTFSQWPNDRVLRAKAFFKWNCPRSYIYLKWQLTFAPASEVAWGRTLPF